MRTPYRKQHVTVRARTRCRLAVLPRDRLDSQALIGVAEQQTGLDNGTASGDRRLKTAGLPPLTVRM
jgi:hypothetical protein